MLENQREYSAWLAMTAWTEKKPNAKRNHRKSEHDEISTLDTALAKTTKMCTLRDILFAREVLY